MQKVVLKANRGDRALNIKQLKSYIAPFIRGMIWAVLLVIATYLLFQRWGQRFPSILWLVPLLVPLLFLKGAVLTFLNDTWIFTNKYVQKTGSNKVRWSSVKSWSCEIESEIIIVKINLTWGRKCKFVFHISHGEKYIRDLFHKNLTMASN